MITLELAFARYGVEQSNRQRLLSATALDGALMLVCQSSGFSRPAAGVLRYSATMSLMRAPRAHLTQLRTDIEAAWSGRTPIRLVIQTLRPEARSNRIHTRADLIGSVSAFDGDAFSVDFGRIAPEESDPTPPKRGKR